MIARKVYLKFSTRLLITLMGLIALSFVSRYMGAEAIGMLGYALSLVGLFLILSDLGLNNTHIKKISEGKNIKKCVGTFAFLKILAIFLMSFVFLIYMYFYGSYRETDEQVLIIYIIFLSVLIKTEQNIPAHIDEPWVVETAIRISNGSFNPDFYRYPSGQMNILAFIYKISSYIKDDLTKINYYSISWIFSRFCVAGIVTMVFIICSINTSYYFGLLGCTLTFLSIVLNNHANYAIPDVPMSFFIMLFFLIISINNLRVYHWFSQLGDH